MLQDLLKKLPMSYLRTKTPSLKFHLKLFRNLDNMLLSRKLFQQASLSKMQENSILILRHLISSLKKSPLNSFSTYSKALICLLNPSIFVKITTPWWRVTILKNLHLRVTFVTITWVTLWWTFLLQAQTTTTTSCLSKPSLTLPQLPQPI